MEMKEKKNIKGKKEADDYSIVEFKGKVALRDNRSKTTFYPAYLLATGNDRLIQIFNGLAKDVGRKLIDKKTGVCKNKNTPVATVRVVNCRGKDMPTGMTLNEFRRYNKLPVKFDRSFWHEYLEVVYGNDSLKKQNKKNTSLQQQEPTDTQQETLLTTQQDINTQESLLLQSNIIVLFQQLSENDKKTAVGTLLKLL